MYVCMYICMYVVKICWKFNYIGIWLVIKLKACHIDRHMATNQFVHAILYIQPWNFVHSVWYKSYIRYIHYR